MAEKEKKKKQDEEANASHLAEVVADAIIVCCRLSELQTRPCHRVCPDKRQMEVSLFRFQLECTSNKLGFPRSYASIVTLNPPLAIPCERQPAASYMSSQMTTVIARSARLRSDT